MGARVSSEPRAPADTRPDAEGTAAQTEQLRRELEAQRHVVAEELSKARHATAQHKAVAEHALRELTALQDQRARDDELKQKAGAAAVLIVFGAGTVGAIGATLFLRRRHHLNIAALRAQMDEAKQASALDLQRAKRYAAEPVVRSLLPAMDSIDALLSSATGSAQIDGLKEGSDPAPPDGMAVPGQADSQLSALLEGAQLTRSSLINALQSHGVRRVDAARGEPFDPHVMEAMFTVADKSAAAGTVASLFRPGYYLHERVLRAAQVGVVADQGPDGGGGSGEAAVASSLAGSTALSRTPPSASPSVGAAASAPAESSAELDASSAELAEKLADASEQPAARSVVPPQTVDGTHVQPPQPTSPPAMPPPRLPPPSSPPTPTPQPLPTPPSPPPPPPPTPPPTPPQPATPPPPQPATPPPPQPIPTPQPPPPPDSPPPPSPSPSSPPPSSPSPEQPPALKAFDGCKAETASASSKVSAEALQLDSSAAKVTDDKTDTQKCISTGAEGSSQSTSASQAPSDTSTSGAPPSAAAMGSAKQSVATEMAQHRAIEEALRNVTISTSHKPTPRAPPSSPTTVATTTAAHASTAGTGTPSTPASATATTATALEGSGDSAHHPLDEDDLSRLLALHAQDKTRWSAAALAEKFKVPLDAVEATITHLSPYKVVQPKKDGKLYGVKLFVRPSDD